MDNFKPYPFLKNGWAQTISSGYLPVGKDRLPKSYYPIELDDGDKLLMAENTASSWKPGDRIIVLVHGLSGHYQSFYMIRQTRYFVAQGYKVFRINLRGCGPGLKHAKQIYHAGRSEDTLKAIQWIARKNPNSQITQVGFSLGANITLKMMGEHVNELPDNFHSGVAISSPLFLGECSDHVHKNRIFELYFLANVKREIALRKKQHPELQFPKLPLMLKSLRHFDGLFTAPVLGFDSAQEFYDHASCFQHLGNINKPTLIVGASDDPIADVFNYHKIPKNDLIDVKLTESGGHVAFMSNNKFRPEFWIDDYLHRWVKQFK